MIIYVAGKYNAPSDGERLRNTNKAIDFGIEVYKRGHYPHIPHLTHWIEKRMDYNGEPPRPNDYWYDFDNLILPQCHAFIKICKDGESKGADAEEILAKKVGLIIFRDLQHIDEWDKIKISARGSRNHYLLCIKCQEPMERRYMDHGLGHYKCIKCDLKIWGELTDS